MSDPGIQSAVNFLVPAAGTTHMFPIYATFQPANPYTVFFDKQGIDGQKFMPSGVFIDNSQGTNPITVTIQEISWSVTCPAGGTLMQPYPAPNSQHAVITGNGVAAVVFVDFPVQPFLYSGPGGGTAVTIANGADVALGSTTDAAVVNPASAATVVSLLKGLLTESPTLGTNVMANSTPVTLATDDTQIGVKTTASTIGAGGSGIIGWLSTVANKLAGLGSNTMANSNPVTLATDDTQIGTKVTAVPALGAGGTGIIGWLSNIVSKFSPNGYPVGAVPLAATSGNVANAAATATFAATASVTNYLSGVQFSAFGATAGGIAGLSITGLLGGTVQYFFTVPTGATNQITPIYLQFNPPIPASAANVAITASVAALGAGNTNAQLNIQGFRV